MLKIPEKKMKSHLNFCENALYSLRPRLEGYIWYFWISLAHRKDRFNYNIISVANLHSCTFAEVLTPQNSGFRFAAA